MKTLATLLPEIEYASDKNLLPVKLSLLSEKINNLFLQVHRCENFQDAEIHFALLGQIQSILAKLIFRDKVEASDALWEFVRDFDRIDDEGTQQFLFDEIKSGRYIYEMCNSNKKAL